MIKGKQNEEISRIEFLEKKVDRWVPWSDPGSFYQLRGPSWPHDWKKITKWRVEQNKQRRKNNRDKIRRGKI